MADPLQPLPVFLSSPLPKPSFDSSPGLGVGHIAGVMGSGASAQRLLPQRGDIGCVSIESPPLANSPGKQCGMGAVLQGRGRKPSPGPSGQQLSHWNQTPWQYKVTVLWDVPRALLPGVTPVQGPTRQLCWELSTSHRESTAEPELLLLLTWLFLAHANGGVHFPAVVPFCLSRGFYC